jgi:Spy/CpxP family protein refolding chaperone
MKISSVLIGGALALALVAPLTSLAQQSPNPASTTQPERGHRGMLPGLRGISLSDQQTAQIKAIVDPYRAAHPRGSTPDPAARKAMTDQVMGVLTPDQQTQFKANMAKMRQHRDGGDAQPNASPSPQS